MITQVFFWKKKLPVSKTRYTPFFSRTIWSSWFNLKKPGSILANSIIDFIMFSNSWTTLSHKSSWGCKVNNNNNFSFLFRFLWKLNFLMQNLPYFWRKITLIDPLLPATVYGSFQLWVDNDSLYEPCKYFLLELLELG